MPGAIPHITIALISSFIVHNWHYKREFSLAIFIGNLLPDAVKLLVSGIAQDTMLILNLQQDTLYQAISRVTNDFTYWISMFLFVMATTAILYHHKAIKRKDMKELNKLFGFVLAGIFIHLILDILIIERSIWW